MTIHSKGKYTYDFPSLFIIRQFIFDTKILTMFD